MAIPQSRRSDAEDLVQASLGFTPLLDLLAEALQRRRIRRSYGRMSDAQLRDIGLIPHDITTALALPLDRCAADALARAAALEAERW